VPAVKLDQIFTEGKSQENIDDLIESFVFNATMVIESYDNLRDNMFSVLAKLSTINIHKFGVHCFLILKELMLSGDEMQHMIKYHLEKDIISRLETIPPD